MNVDKIREVYEFAVWNPKKLKQHDWTDGEIQKLKTGKPENHNPLECNTTGCMAGWRSIFSAPKGTQFYIEDLVLPNGDVFSYKDYATAEFGLSSDEAYCLFYHTDNLNEVRSCLLEIFYDRNELTPEWLQNELDTVLYGYDDFLGICE